MIGQLVLSASGTVLEHVLTVFELVWTWLFLFVMSVVASVLGRVVKAVVHEVALFASPVFLPLLSDMLWSLPLCILWLLSA